MLSQDVNTSILTSHLLNWFDHSHPFAEPQGRILGIEPKCATNHLVQKISFEKQSPKGSPCHHCITLGRSSLSNDRSNNALEYSHLSEGRKSGSQSHVIASFTSVGDRGLQTTNITLPLSFWSWFIDSYKFGNKFPSQRATERTTRRESQIDMFRAVLVHKGTRYILDLFLFSISGKCVREV